MKSQESAYKKKLKNLLESSTWIGLSNIARTQTTLVKIIWALSFITALIYTGYSIILMILDYFNYAVLINLEILQDFEAEFPTITFCNLNPIDLTYESNRRDIKSFIFNLTGSNVNFLGNVTDSDVKCDRSVRNLLRNNLRLAKYGYALEKMFIECYFDDKPCSINDFHEEQSPIFGKCYSFNSGKNITGHEIPILKAKRTGMINLFELRLFIGAPEYQPCWNDLNGVIVVIHNKTTVPLYVEDAIKVQPGLQTNIVFNKLIYNKLGHPFSGCINDVTDPNAFNSESFRITINSIKIYRQNWCILNCALRIIRLENNDLCRNSNFTNPFFYNQCLNDLSNLTNYYPKCAKECPIECNTITFIMNSNIADYPSYSHASWLLTNDQIKSKFPYSNPTYDQLKKSVLSFTANYQSFDYHKITEIQAVSATSLLGTIGGQVGLFMGVSLLSFVEILEILIEMFIIFFKNKSFVK